MPLLAWFGLRLGLGLGWAKIDLYVLVNDRLVEIHNPASVTIRISVLERVITSNSALEDDLSLHLRRTRTNAELQGPSDGVISSNNAFFVGSLGILRYHNHWPPRELEMRRSRAPLLDALRQLVSLGFLLVDECLDLRCITRVERLGKRVFRSLVYRLKTIFGPRHEILLGGGHIA